MLHTKNNLGIKIISIFVVIAFLSSSFCTTPSQAKGTSGKNLSPQLLFKRLDDNKGIKNMAMLEYVLVSNIFSQEQDIMEWAEAKNKITTSILDDDVSFDFQSAIFDRPLGLALVPCHYGKTLYWCFAKRKDTPDEQTGLSYDVTFYTDEEISEQGAVKSLNLLKIAERKEHLAIKMASDSERKHDEKIRQAILSNKYFSITEENFKSLVSVYEFLNAVSPKLSSDFRDLVESGQLMAITETKEDLRLDEPHAGGRGIYLPNEPEYFKAQVIVHEAYAKAGFTHEEALRMEEIFTQFVKRKTDAIIDKPGKLPEWMSFTPDQEKALELAKFVNLTDVIKTRDYSNDQETGPSLIPQKKGKPIRVLHVESDEGHALLAERHLKQSGFDVVEYMRVDTAQGLKAALNSKEWDVVLSDYNMPGFSGKEAAKIFKDKKLSIPFILITGINDLYVLADMFKLGITDYVNKDDMGVRLGPTVARSLEGAKNQASRAQELGGSGKNRLMNILPIGVHIVDSLGVIKDVNDRELELLGYTREEMVGQSIFNFIHPSQVAEAMKRFHAKLSGKLSENEKVDRLYVKKDGSTIIGYTQDYVLRNPVGTPIDIVTSFEDITERRKTEKALEESEAKFKEVFTESPIGFVVIDKSGNIFDANPAALSIIGTSSLAPLMGRNASKYFDFIETAKGPLYGEAVLDYDKLREKGAEELEKKGKIFVKYSLTPVGVDDEDTQPNRYHLQLQDITRAHEREEELKSAYKELEKQTLQLFHSEKLSAIGENTKALADGINNPANNIKSIVEDLLARMLNGTVVETSEVERVLRKVTEEIARITAVNERFMGFARAHTGMMPVSIQDILTDALEVRKFVTKNLGVKVIVENKEDWSVIIADKVVLTQAFADMILNAATSMKGADTKELTITTQHKRDEDGRDWVKVSFNDTGRGLSKAELDDIWNPFHKDGESGLDAGFGMVIVKDMVNEHGGHIKVDSELGKGTTFTMEFPTIRHYKEEIKQLSGLEMANIYGSLWHDLNNTLAMAYNLEMLLDDDVEIPQDLRDRIKFIFGEAKKIVGLIKQAHHTYASETILGEIDKNLRTLKDSVEAILLVEVAPEISVFFKEAMSQVSEKIASANKKIEEGNKLLHAVHTVEAKEDIYKGLWRALDSLMNDAEKFLDIGMSVFAENQNPEISNKMVVSKDRMTEARRFLDRALANREEILTKIEQTVTGVIPQVEELADRMSDMSADDIYMVTGAKEGFEETVDKIREVRQMLGIEQSFDEPLTKVKALVVLKSVASFFETSKRFFKQNNVGFDGVEVLSHEAENLFIKADDPAFRYALYNVLNVGFGEDKEDKRKLKPKNKKIDISIDRNGTTGEVIITFKNNYYSFSEEDLEEVDLGQGEKGPAILKWQNGDSTMLAQAHKILASFAGRITVRSSEHESTIRMIMPYIEDTEMVSDKADDAPKTEPGKKPESEEIDKTFEGWPDKIVKGQPNILIVDDEEMIRDLVKNMLGRGDYNIWKAADGVEALEVMEKMREAGEEVNLGLFDISMPNMGGVELVRTSKDRGYKFPILVMTGHASTDPQVIQLQEDGTIEGLLRKPFSGIDMKARVKKLTQAASIPKDERALELQMISAEKVALVYGENAEEGINKLRALGFKGEVQIAKDENALKSLLASGQQFDFIVNTTGEDIKTLLKRIFTEFEAVPAVVDAEDMQLQTKLITICA